MKKYSRRIVAFLMTVVMVVSMCVVTFAAKETSDEEATIKGIEAETGIEVTAYKIVDYDPSGEYKPLLDGIIDDVTNITGNQVWEFADNLDQLKISVPIDRKKGNDYVASKEDNLTPGVWMIIVNGSSKYLYNPAILSVMQEANGYKYGILDYDNDTWNSTIYVKRAEPKITKEAVNEDGTDTVKGVQYGNILKFTVTSDIPGYADNMSNIQYTISDKLDGLKLVKDETHSPSVQVKKADGSDAGEKGATTLLKNTVSEAVINEAESFLIDLSGKAENGWDAWIKDNRGNKIIITYYARVTSEKKINVDKTTNNVTLQYSTNDKTQTKIADTKHYTFGIDTGFNKELQQDLKNQTGEFIKIDENGNVAYEEKDGNPTSVKTTSPLAGAQFQLHIESETGSLFTHGANADGNYFETDSNGRLQINGLDSDVTYYLVETKAPLGYSRITEPIKVTITADYPEGVLTGYSVKFETKGNEATTNYKYEEVTGTTTLINEEGSASNPFGFKNTKLSELPSTGGIGTYIFTITGVLIMAGVAGMFIISRRKEHE